MPSRTLGRAAFSTYYDLEESNQGQPPEDVASSRHASLNFKPYTWLGGGGLQDSPARWEFPKIGDPNIVPLNSSKP